ncbi:thioesterase [Suicoccus acidiformans]|uniref:Thioesterase n=1 Tax=Suicoccus acidiformans TaxID=2036206 RepID=A0A347WL68_9LACT|nr:hotdog domain-containing protein [Suicoccus acidiformans]AXY25825.1 thioesterase [Suicoccus acidiformans]
MMDKELSQAFTIQEEDTARAVGSGTLDVLATPRLISWMEYVARLLCQGEEAGSDTSVGIEIHMKHLAPSAVGSEITVTASLSDTHKSIRTYKVEAHMGDKLVAEGEHKRAIVNQDEFMKQL